MITKPKTTQNDEKKKGQSEMSWRKNNPYTVIYGSLIGVPIRQQ